MQPGLVPYPLVGGGISDETRRQLYQNFSALERLLGTGFTDCNINLGDLALASISTGADNVGVGCHALENLTTGQNNIGIGFQALFGATTTDSSVAIGGNTLSSLVSGGAAVAIGKTTFGSLVSGTGAVAVGSEAGYAPGGNIANATTTALRQTLIGAETGQASSTQRDDVVALGYRALVNGAKATSLGATASAGAANATAAGYGASAGAAGAIAIGRDSAGTSATTATADEAAIGTALTSLKCGNPGGGQGAWMFGQYKAAAVTLDTANYIEVKIDGTLRKLAIVT